MAVVKREQLDAMLTAMQEKDPAQVYLLVGERFLCQQAADRISSTLLQGGGNTHFVDGETEDFSTTLHRLASYSLFPGRQIYRVTDTRLFHSVKVAESLWKKAARAREDNNSVKSLRYLKAMLEAAGLDGTDPENDPVALSASRWKKLFGFNRPQDDLSWISALLADLTDKSENEGLTTTRDSAALLEKTLVAGIPAQNYLILLAEDVDKRKRLYKYLADHHTVVDLGVESGAGSKAQNAQKSVVMDLVNRTLADFGKTMTPQAAEILFERIGFHPVAVVMETEKLALYTETRRKIDVEDLDAVVGRTRQEAVFELTDALGKSKIEQVLLITRRLTAQGMHPLALLAAIKNYVRTLLLFRALQEKPETGYSQSMPPGVFQQQVLPRLKQDGHWKQELSGHPYALYMQFKTAAGFSLETLQDWLEKILRADLRIKGSAIHPESVLQHLLISLLAGTGNANLQNNHGALHYRSN